MLVVFAFIVLIFFVYQMGILQYGQRINFYLVEYLYNGLGTVAVLYFPPFDLCLVLLYYYFVSYFFLSLSLAIFS